MNRVIFHIDVNSAFLSWASVARVKAGESDLRRVPSAVSGDPSKRTSVVLAKSIPAKKFDVRTGEPISMALKKCPGLVIVPPDFSLYVACSRAFKAICADYSPLMEEFSIDECFLDMSGMEHLYPNILDAAYELKDRIKNELGFTVNVGVGSNKLLAKMASDFEKPDKVHTLFAAEVESKMWPLPVRDLLFLGKATAEKLERLSIITIGDLATADPSVLRPIVGEKMSRQLHARANGMDSSPVEAMRPKAKSYSHSITPEENVTDYDTADALLLALTDAAAARMRADHCKAFNVSVVIRDTDFKNRSHQRQLDCATDVTRDLYTVAKSLLRELWNKAPLRLLGVALSDLTDGTGMQFSLFGGEDGGSEKQRKIDAAVDAVRGKYGKDTLLRGATMGVRRPKK